ncbi:MAG: hypothetical protein KGK10_07210 [Rhodospirillales bacterium]|nr:hypothetical protein [Rhodospirillales bacterium]
MAFRIVTTDDVQTSADRRTAGLAAVAVLLLLIVAGVWVTRELVAAEMLEACIASGNHHCEERLPALRRLLPADWN